MADAVRFADRRTSTRHEVSVWRTATCSMWSYKRNRLSGLSALSRRSDESERATARASGELSEGPLVSERCKGEWNEPSRLAKGESCMFIHESSEAKVCVGTACVRSGRSCDAFVAHAGRCGLLRLPSEGGSPLVALPIRVVQPGVGCFPTGEAFSPEQSVTGQTLKLYTASARAQHATFCSCVSFHGLKSTQCSTFLICRLQFMFHPAWLVHSLAQEAQPHPPRHDRQGHYSDKRPPRKGRVCLVVWPVSPRCTGYEPNMTLDLPVPGRTPPNITSRRTSSCSQATSVDNAPTVTLSTS